MASKTRVRDYCALLPRSARKHFQECAEEMGIETQVPVSHERRLRYRGHEIEIWFDERGSVFAWKAFAKGIGTVSGMSEAEAITDMKNKINRVRR